MSTTVSGDTGASSGDDAICGERLDCLRHERGEGPWDAQGLLCGDREESLGRPRPQTGIR